MKSIILLIISNTAELQTRIENAGKIRTVYLQVVKQIRNQS